MKKILSMFLALCMVFAMAPIGAFADDIISGDGYSYNLETNVLTITANAGATSTSPWKSAYKDKVISIIVEDGVTAIGGSAFYNCFNLTSVHIGNGTQSIGSNAFSNCPKLESVHFGKSVNSIGYVAFATNPKLTTLTVDAENTVYKTVDNVMFTADEKKLLQYPEGKTNENYEVPSSVETFDFRAFYRNTYIKGVTLTDSVTKIAAQGFYGCTNLTMISLGTKLETIGAQAFAECSKLFSMYIPATVTTKVNRHFKVAAHL